MEYNMNPTIQLIQDELDRETEVKPKGKLSPDFINQLASTAHTIYLQPTPTMRMCILQLSTGHEVYGVSQVLKSENDVEKIGNKVAFDNAKNEIWSTIGSIAKILL